MLWDEVKVMSSNPRTAQAAHDIYCHPCELTTTPASLSSSLVLFVFFINVQWENVLFFPTSVHTWLSHTTSECQILLSEGEKRKGDRSGGEKKEYHLNNVCVSDRAFSSAPRPQGENPLQFTTAWRYTPGPGTPRAEGKGGLTCSHFTAHIDLCPTVLALFVYLFHLILCDDIKFPPRLTLWGEEKA